MSNPLYPYASDEIQRLLYYIANNTADIDTYGSGSTLPSQTGQSGKFLTTNGTATSWGTPSGSPANVKAGSSAVTAATASLAIVFGGTAFSAAPVVTCNLIPPGGGNLIAVAPTSVTSAGFTANWGFAIPAGYTLAWIATPATQ
jgi:hypothetical protein